MLTWATTLMAERVWLQWTNHQCRAEVTQLQVTRSIVVLPHPIVPLPHQKKDDCVFSSAVVEEDDDNEYDYTLTDEGYVRRRRKEFKPQTRTSFVATFRKFEESEQLVTMSSVGSENRSGFIRWRSTAIQWSSSAGTQEANIIFINEWASVWLIEWVSG